MTISRVLRRTAWIWGPAVLLGLGGCSVNPATGQRQLTLLSEQQEIQMGKENDQQIVAQMGLYPDEEWQGYIQDLGSRLAAKSERPDLPWTFRVVDDPIVNAFALPGGYIYITRGILAHFNSEAQLVSVLGHEIGHVTGRHTVERVSKAQLASVGVGIAAVAGGGDLANLAGQGLGLLFLKFSRDDEREADDLGLRYLTRGTYDPYEMPKVFNTLDRISGAQGSRAPSWLATHPAPANRALRIQEQIGQLPAEQQAGRVERDGYLQRLSELTFGANPREGYSIGRTFYHPDLAFKLEFPEGWKIINQRSMVGALSPEEDAFVVLSLAGEATPEEAQSAFFRQEGVEQGRKAQSFTYFQTTPQPETGKYLQGIARFLSHGDQVFRLLSYTRDDSWQAYETAMGSSVGSFRRLKNRRYLDVQPQKVELVRLKGAMTLEDFNRHYPSTLDLEALAILNGVEVDQRLETGTLVKRIVGGKLPES